MKPFDKLSPSPPAQPETVLCAVVGFESGLYVYYGRGVLSGQWFSGIDSALAKLLEPIALSEGQRVIIHPYGPLLFPHRWLIDNGPAEFSAKLKEMETLFESHPPQSG